MLVLAKLQQLQMRASVHKPLSAYRASKRPNLLLKTLVGTSYHCGKTLFSRSRLSIHILTLAQGKIEKMTKSFKPCETTLKLTLSLGTLYQRQVVQDYWPGSSLPQTFCILVSFNIDAFIRRLMVETSDQGSTLQQISTAVFFLAYNRVQ